jgi:murein DD-endopeptidase MepM/ murein hydrolase activator NlpD
VPVGTAIVLPAGSAFVPGAYAAPGSPAPDGAAVLASLPEADSLALPGDRLAPSPSDDNARQGPSHDQGQPPPAQELTRQQYVMTEQVAALAASQDALDAIFAGGGSGRYGWPERYRTISQPFGCTSVHQAPTSSSCPSGHFHTGDDIAGPDQTGVFAADTGVARVFHGSTGYGNYVIVTHGNGWATLYGHLHDIAVQDGQVVQRGDLIAHEGSTGNSTGSHLHFEVRKDGQYVDPCPFLEGCGKNAG